MITTRRVLLLCAGGLAAAFLLALVHPFGNARLSPATGHAAAWGASGMPPGIRDILAAKCADCHSLEPRLPLYAHIAPASWLMERDVLRARAAMNLSQWDKSSAEDRQQMVQEIARVAKQRRMPPPQYLALHWSARLTNAERRAIGDWAESAHAVRAAQTDGNSEPGDAGRGKLVFQRRCTGCHALDRDREGPRLTGVYGRTAGSVKGFDYSAALRRSRVVWDEAALSRWLADPDSVAPGNNMDFHVADPRERADVIQFLRAESGN